MGGGDLNLKKSWHPQTMKNQEKVWKAEQAKNLEEQKLNDLKREIEEERNREDLKRLGQASGVLQNNENDKKLEWMYKSSTDMVNREDYLLGRSIDKSFEMLQAEEQKKSLEVVGVKPIVNHVEHECIPFSIRTYRKVESNEQVDLQRKVLEDPLMLIKQREMESRRKLLENPVKLKELHRLLKTEQEIRKAKESKRKKEKKSKKSKKTKKKHKKSKRNSSSSDSDSNSSESGKDLDKELEKRYTKLLNREEELSGLNITKLLDAKYETLSKELDKAVKSKQTKKSHRSRSRGRDRDMDRRSCREESSRDQKNYSPANRNEQRRRVNCSDRHKQSRLSCFRSATPTRRNRNAMNSQKEHQGRRQRRSRTRSRSRSSSSHSSKHYANGKTQSITTSRNKNSCSSSSKLSTEEKEKRLQEMMQNAAWRDVDRTKAVHKHREEYAREEEQMRGHTFDKEFINKEVRKAISTQHSVGSRLRANMNNIQRTSAALNTNFARK